MRKEIELNQPVKAYTLTGLENKIKNEEALFYKLLADGKGKWGNWVFDPQIYVLRHQQYSYEVDLERITTIQDLVDWMCHLNNKLWITADDIGNLFVAIDDIYNHNIEHKNRCGGKMSIVKLMEMKCKECVENNNNKKKKEK